MATYFNGAPGIQADGMQTLYLMNPAYVSGGYSDHSATAAHRTDMFFLNSPLNSQNAIPHPHRQQQQQQQFVLMGSKYLKAAQQLLGQAVSVGMGRSKSSMAAGGGKDLEGERGSDGGGGAKKASDLSAAEREELQMKKDKLVNMLDEVEQRYRRYRQQMQVVVSAFESAAGFGSAQGYTALALRTISKQFRCLRDVISRQIRAAGRSLGEEDGKPPVGPRLRYVDNHLRQQRELQKLGMVQHDDWRPQRGLPERAVSVLRAWLFEHFLHPYPRDSDKHMLAKRTGLTRSQVSNWFINARVRLWKPMVEEMYMEETNEQEHNDGNINNGEASEQSASINAPTTEPPPQQQMQPPVVHQNAIQTLMGQGAGLGAYGLGRFDHDEQLAPRFGDNGVSLTLGLPRREAVSLSGSQQPSYLSNESISYFSLDGSSNPSASPAPNAYGSINVQSRQRVAAQLLPDLVA